MMNNWSGTGRLTRDPELRYSPNGTAVTKFTLAVDRGYTSQDGTSADFIPIVTMKQLAETAANYLRKGRLVGIEGRIQTRSYEGNDNKRVFVTEVLAHRLHFLESNKDNKPKSDDPFKDDGKPIDISDDDLPF
ncbi:single-stranded DNA-binding protein [Paenibacillus sp. FSL R5-0527]|uniref:single-stranded DNA-binding protein n=1 Tax=Paenibacillus sp. FSL R5-0527 TaxID=2975321 RepID=UPI00097B67E5|nr:single-stranded DNA-binding protein [Paenibacillus macerans]